MTEFTSVLPPPYQQDHLWNSSAIGTLRFLMPTSSSNQPHTMVHPRDPLHGITLETIVTTLVARHGWATMGARVPIRCFRHHPTIRSSLTFLRKTPWARKRVEQMFLAECRAHPN
jgi:DNA-binding protein VF530